MLPLGFWIWHDKIEDQHAAHTSDELEQAFAMPHFDQEKFIQVPGTCSMVSGLLGRPVERPRGGSCC